MIDSASPAGSPSARLRVRALRLIAERRIGHRLTHVGAVELLERHGGVDAAVEALTAERAPRPVVERTERAESRQQAAPRAEPSRARPDGVAAPVVTNRVSGRLRTAALATAAVTALLVAVAALGRVAVAANAAHGARGTLLLGSTLLLVAVVTGLATRRERRSSPVAEVAALGLCAVTAFVVRAGEECALAVPFGLERLLDGQLLAGAVALIAAAIGIAAIVSVTDRASR